MGDLVKTGKHWHDCPDCGQRWGCERVVCSDFTPLQCPECVDKEIVEDLEPLLSSDNVFTAVFFLVGWLAFTGFCTYWVFVKGPVVIQETRERTIALKEDINTPHIVQGAFKGVRLRDELRPQILVSVGQEEVEIRPRKSSKEEFKVGDPVHFYYHRYSKTYGWEPIAAETYYWEYLKGWGNVAFLYLVGSISLICLLYYGIKAVFWDLPRSVLDAQKGKRAWLPHNKLRH